LSKGDSREFLELGDTPNPRQEISSCTSVCAFLFLDGRGYCLCQFHGEVQRGEAPLPGVRGCPSSHFSIPPRVGVRGLKKDYLEVLRIAKGGTGETKLARDRPTLPRVAAGSIPHLSMLGGLLNLIQIIEDLPLCLYDHGVQSGGARCVAWR
jgi:hypothetical protein